MSLTNRITEPYARKKPGTEPLPHSRCLLAITCLDPRVALGSPPDQASLEAMSFPYD